MNGRSLPCLPNLTTQSEREFLMPFVQIDPLLFCSICLGWALLCGASGAYKAFFEAPPEGAE